MKAYFPSSTNRKQATDRRQTIVDFFAHSEQQFLPILELLIDAKEQLYNFAHNVGVAAIEGLLELSANERCGGLPPPGKKFSPESQASADRVPVRRHGDPHGVVVLGQSKLRVRRPRLRTIPDESGRTHEVPPPA